MDFDLWGIAPSMKLLCGIALWLGLGYYITAEPGYILAQDKDNHAYQSRRYRPPHRYRDNF